MNPYGKHSLDDLDESWYRYLKADREERKAMCEDMQAADGIACAIGFVIIIGGLIVALCKGWI